MVKNTIKQLIDLNNILIPFIEGLAKITEVDAKIPEETITSGSTLTPPNENLKIGQQYFDTTLGVPVYWNGTEWHNPFANITTVEVENH
jgi:hypothetical protein